MLVQGVADRDDRRVIAAAHAGRADDPDLPSPSRLVQIAQQRRRSGEFAAEAVADPHRQRRRRLLVVHDDVEMGVERGDLVDLDKGQPHLLGERRQMARMEAAEMVLQQMQVLDQQIAAPLAVAEQGLHLVQGRRIDLPALRMVEPAPPPRARMDAAVVPYRGMRMRTPLRLQRERPSPATAREGEVESEACPHPTLGAGVQCAHAPKPPPPCASRRSRPCRSRASRGPRRCARPGAASASPRPASRRG